MIPHRRLRLRMAQRLLRAAYPALGALPERHLRAALGHGARIIQAWRIKTTTRRIPKWGSGWTNLRPGPEGRTWAKTVEEGISLTEAGNDTVASLDHDPREGIDGGYRLVLWMAEIFARDSVEP